MSKRSIQAQPPDPRQALGREGEALAARHLASCGYEIVAQNLRTKLGEIDLLALDRGVLVFVEVKTRRNTRFGAGCEAVTARKQVRMQRIAQLYLGPALDRRPIRFDVVDIVIPRGATPQLRHIVGAF
ncbi:MAG: YraN family protein [Cyanobacteria bacterium REEB65]|nr:YraN family protein [Cyanobacteria bacterium REEB65]